MTAREDGGGSLVGVTAWLEITRGVLARVGEQPGPRRTGCPMVRDYDLLGLRV